MKTILFIHQGAELYGSDKVLADLVICLSDEKYRPIVILPAEGPLYRLLKENNVDVRVAYLSIIGRKTMTLHGLTGLRGDLKKSIESIDNVLFNESVDLVHSNTLAVLSGAFWARHRKIPHIWHVHEIIMRPILVRITFSILLVALAKKVIFNSHAAKKNMSRFLPIVSLKSTVIWNGISPNKNDASLEYDSKQFRVDHSISDDSLLILLVGRINRWKGHYLLLSSLESLYNKGFHNFNCIFIGGPPPGQDNLLTELQDEIEKRHVRKQVKILPFAENISAVWKACDIAIVPSTEPEPFGMVALEAMNHSKPVIASDHGGLTEIVIDGVTGLLFTPNDENDLEECIRKLITNKDIRQKMGQQAKERVLNIFNLKDFILKVENVYNDILH